MILSIHFSALNFKFAFWTVHLIFRDAILVHLGLSLPPEGAELFGDPEIMHDLATFGSNHPGNAAHHWGKQLHH